MKYVERCSCGAKLTLETISASHAQLIAWAKEWRIDHRHDMPELELELEKPLIHESGSSHERAEPFWIGHEIPA